MDVRKLLDDAALVYTEAPLEEAVEAEEAFIADAIDEELQLQDAKAAAMREALEALLDEQNGPPLERRQSSWLAAVAMSRAVLLANAGAAMLERVRRAEDEAKALLSGVLAITPAGRLPFDGWEKELTAARDAAQRALSVCEQQRDEAREALRLLLEEAGDPERQGSRHTGDGLAMSQPCRDAVARILEVKP